MKFADYVTLACLALVVVAIFVARRRGKAAAAAAIASARAEGHADAKAEAAASASVDLGGIHFGAAAGLDGGASIALEDAIRAEVGRLLVGRISPGGNHNNVLDAARSHDYDHSADYDDDGASATRVRVLRDVRHGRGSIARGDDVRDTPRHRTDAVGLDVAALADRVIADGLGRDDRASRVVDL